MDIVITFVNGLDPEWQKSYETHTKTPIIEKRFRDCGTLKLLMSGIEKNLPFIRKVHLVVSQESQIPQWVNRENVNIVLHRNIIPSTFLPTFNSNTIELHLHRIKGLDEEFLYFNDDMFPVTPAQPEDFFRNGKAVIKFTKHWFALNMFKKICNNSYKLACKASEKKYSKPFLRPQHICSPMLRSCCEEVYRKVKSEILTSISLTRNDENYTQYLFLDYMFLNDRVINEKIEKKHFSLAITSAEKIIRFITHPTRKMVCINDVRLSERRYKKLHKAIINAFNIRFPNKSKYEI